MNTDRNSERTYQRTTLTSIERGRVMARVEMSRLELGNGELGHPFLSLIIEVGRGFLVLRFNADQEPSDVDALAEIVRTLNMDPTLYGDYQRALTQWNEEKEARDQRRREKEDGNGGNRARGHGLGQYSRPGKTERKRQRGRSDGRREKR